MEATYSVTVKYYPVGGNLREQQVRHEVYISREEKEDTELPEDRTR